MNYSKVMNEATSSGKKIHPISLEPQTARELKKLSPPRLPSYGVKQNDLKKVTVYLNQLSSRLSIPKLNSNDP
jgi:hypothetical protein